jgi:hypothetical protein
MREKSVRHSLVISPSDIRAQAEVLCVDYSAERSITGMWLPPSGSKPKNSLSSMWSSGS